MSICLALVDLAGSNAYSVRTAHLERQRQHHKTTIFLSCCTVTVAAFLRLVAKTAEVPDLSAKYFSLSWQQTAAPLYHEIEPMLALGTPLSADNVYHHTDPSHVPKNKVLMSVQHIAYLVPAVFVAPTHLPRTKETFDDVDETLHK